MCSKIFKKYFCGCGPSLGRVEGCSSNSSVYLNDRSVPRCSRQSWLVMTMFSIYILMTSIMLINLLIAIFRWSFLHFIIIRRETPDCIIALNLWLFNIFDFSPVDYRILVILQEWVCQQPMRDIDKLRQRLIDQAIDRWQFRLRARVMARGGQKILHFQIF